jgi:hypothetical protein
MSNQIRQLSSQGAFVKVESKERTYERVIICPNFNNPMSHLLEAYNGDVVEVNTVDLVALNDVLL